MTLSVLTTQTVYKHHPHRSNGCVLVRPLKFSVKNFACKNKHFKGIDHILIPSNILRFQYACQIFCYTVCAAVKADHDDQQMNT